MCLSLGVVDVSRLRVFRSVVASGSVQAAATNLGYTPSAVSQQISQLQRETGLTLFEKVGRGIVPTAAAKVLAAESDEVVGALARLDHLVGDLRAGRTASLSIGCFASAGEEWVPVLARRLREEYADVHLTIDLTEMEDASTRRQLATDIEVRTEIVDDVPVVRSGYTRTELITEPYYVVVPEGHPVADLDEVPMSELAGEQWIGESVPGQVCSLILRRAIRSAGVTPRFAARCQDHHTAMALAAVGLGVTLVPRLTLGALPAGAVARPVVDPVPERRIAILVRDAATTNVVALRAVEILREIAGFGTDDGAIPPARVRGRRPA